MGQRIRAVRRLRRLEGFALALPHDLPSYTTVYGYFQKWRGQGKWQEIYARLPSKESQGRVKSIVISANL